MWGNISQNHNLLYYIQFSRVAASKISPSELASLYQKYLQLEIPSCTEGIPKDFVKLCRAVMDALIGGMLSVQDALVSGMDLLKAESGCPSKTRHQQQQTEQGLRLEIDPMGGHEMSIYEKEGGGRSPVYMCTRGILDFRLTGEWTLGALVQQ